jgi:hypothetical protein
MSLNGMPIQMLNGVQDLFLQHDGIYSTGSGLGVIRSREEVLNFFVGDQKWTKNTVPTPVYRNPGEASIRTIPALESFKIVGINQSGGWGKLSTGEWVLIADSMFTVILSVEPPKGVADAITRELERAFDAVPWLPSFKTTLVILAGVGIVIGLVKLKQAGIIDLPKLSLGTKSAPALAGPKRRKRKK